MSRGKRHIVARPPDGNSMPSGAGMGNSSAALVNTDPAPADDRASATSPVHATRFTPRPTHPGQKPSAPWSANATVAPTCQTTCHTGISPVYQPAKKLPTENSSCRAGRNAFSTNSPPKTLTAKYAHDHAMAPSSLTVRGCRTPVARHRCIGGCTGPTSEGGYEHGETERAGCRVLVPGDPEPPHACVDGGDLRPVDGPRGLLVREAAWAGVVPPGTGADLQPPPGRGAVPSRPSLLGRRPDLRPRLSHAPRRAAVAGRDRGAGAVRR